LNDWRTAFLDDSKHLVEEATTHLMELVEED